MVAILRSHGIGLIKTTLAHDFLSEALMTSHPFVNRALWVDDTVVSEDVYAEVDNLLVTASRHGQLPFSELLATKIVRVAKMTYDDQGDAATWHPQVGVIIDPGIHSGAPCLEGTRISTGSCTTCIFPGNRRTRSQIGTSWTSTKWNPQSNGKSDW